MNTILKNLQSLSGVREAFVYLEQDGFFSTVVGNKRNAMQETAPLIEQIFAALAVIGKDHDQIYFSTHEQMLAAYYFKDVGMVMLLTDRKVNVPLIHLSVKLASARIRAMLASGTISAPPPMEDTPEVEVASQPTDQPKSKKLLGKLWNMVYLE